jgi:hypothetical protein
LGWANRYPLGAPPLVAGKTRFAHETIGFFSNSSPT